MLPIEIKEQYFDKIILSALLLLLHIKSSIIHNKTNRYGTVKVKFDCSDNKIVLLNNDISHGERYIKNTEDKIIYYGSKSNGPVASIFDIISVYKNSKVAVLGLGTGSIASFAKEGQELTFYEINPEIIKIAKNTRFFQFLSKSLAKIRIIEGDARDKLCDAKDCYYNLICMDVYIGNKIPNYFLTIEAINLYLKKMTKKGILLIHVSGADNKYESHIAKIVDHLGLYGYSFYHSSSSVDESKKRGLFNDTKRESKIGSFLQYFNWLFASYMIKNKRCMSDSYSWIAISTDHKNLASIEKSVKWQKLHILGNQELCTDQKIGYRHNKVITMKI